MTTETVTDETLLAVLLVAGHLVADFLVQNTGVVARKNEFKVLLRHGGETWLTHVAVLWPIWSWPLLLGVTGIVAVHLIIDAWKARARSGVATFLLDQSLHLLVLAGGWGILVFVLPVDVLGQAAGFRLGWYAWSVLMLGLVAFNLRGGSSLVRLTLESPRPDLTEAGGDRGRGETIGYLERILVMIAVIAGQWSLVGLVMAAKSIARFKELDNRDFAEYYLLGTLMSILVAVVSGSIALWTCGICW